MTTLALVALSARMLAEAAAQDGYDVVALDLFGDVDTRRASTQWMPAAEPGASRIDDALVLAGLRHLARRGDVMGWVAGGGCEGHLDLLAAGAAVLPLIGTAPADVARVRDPRGFFAFLAGHGIAHPEVRWAAPADRKGWLLKDARGCGGWHIREATTVAPQRLATQQYFQCRVAGTPMSATFCADGHHAVVLGFNELTVRALDRPYVYCGAVGPVPLPADAAREATRAVRLLTAGMSLRGLCSLDFVLNEGGIQVLELNPRPPASMVLYRRQLEGGLMAAHVRACLHGRLPPLSAPTTDAVAGHDIVYAPRALRLSAADAARLHDRPDCHDLPAAGTVFARGDPLCSLSAVGDTPLAVRSHLQAAHAAVLHTLEIRA